jgi:hypothetical protein
MGCKVTGEAGQGKRHLLITERPAALEDELPRSELEPNFAVYGKRPFNQMF